MLIEFIGKEEQITLLKHLLKNKKMKPFNLEEALAGKPVITRDGKKVTHIRYFPELEGKSEPVSGVVDNESIETFSSDGKYVPSSTTPFDYDLFMDVEKVSGYVNVYQSSTLEKVIYLGSGFYKTYQEARSNGKGTDYIKTIPIEFEL